MKRGTLVMVAVLALVAGALVGVVGARLGGETATGGGLAALAETEGDYDGRWLYINDRANGRIGMVDLADFKTKEIVDIPNISTSHGGVFVTPNTEYAHISSMTPLPLGGHPG